MNLASIKNMKVLQVIPSLTCGGAETFVKDLSMFMARQSISITILTFVACNDSTKQTLGTAGVEVASINSRKMYSLRNILFMIRYLKANHFDIIHTHLTPAQFCLAIVDCLIRFKSPVITTEHSTHNKRRNNKLLKHLDRFIYSRFKKTICVSKATQQSLLEWLPSIKSKCCVIHNGVDLNKFHIERNWDIQKSIIKVLYVARIVPEKGHDTLLKAMSLTKNTHLFIVGDGCLKEHYVQLTNELEIEDRVNFLGELSDVSNVIKSADIFIHPSHYEGLSIAVLEAMAGGLVMITSNIPSHINVVGNAGLCFAAGNTEELANIINKVASDINFMRKLSTLAAEKAKFFSLENSVNQHLKLYNMVTE